MYTIDWMSAKPILKRKTTNRHTNNNPNEKHPKSSKQVAFGPNVPHIIEWSTYPTPAKGTIPPYPRNTRRIGEHIGPNVPVNQKRSNRNATSAAARNMRPHIAHSVEQDMKRFVLLATKIYPYYEDIYIKTNKEYKDLVIFYYSMQKAEQDLLEMYPSTVEPVLYFGEKPINSTIIENAFMSMIDDYRRHNRRHTLSNGGRRITRKRKQRKY